MRHLSIVFLIVILGVAPSCNFIKNKGLFGKKAKTLAALLAQQDSIRVADSIRKVQDQILAIENAKLDSIRLAEEAKQLAAKTSKYNIIVGSFITPEYANGHAEAYRMQGYDTKVIKMEGTDFELVSAESHQSLKKAISRLQQFQDTVEIDAWIFIRE
jgi:cell division protein FtsN